MHTIWSKASKKRPSLTISLVPKSRVQFSPRWEEVIWAQAGVSRESAANASGNADSRIPPGGLCARPYSAPPHNDALMGANHHDRVGAGVESREISQKCRPPARRRLRGAGVPLIPQAPSTIFPQSLADLIEICRTRRPTPESLPPGGPSVRARCGFGARQDSWTRWSGVIPFR
jgi:hypothetical protein